jgi:hypothetical protein
VVVVCVVVRVDIHKRLFSLKLAKTLHLVLGTCVRKFSFQRVIIKSTGV